jgi:shikimate dehydrogenase
VRHSRSPAMHNAAFAAHGLDLVYLAFDVVPDDLPAAVVGLRAVGAVGANVTVPHKERIVPLLDELDPIAHRTGAVNTLVNREGRLVGHNTDTPGFLAALRSGWGRGPTGARCLVLGAGGAARAVVSGLISEEASDIWVHNRTASRASALAEEATDWSSVPVRAISDADLPLFAQQADLVVNATSVGLDDEVKVTLIPVDTLHGGQCVMDLVYSSHRTPFLSAAAARGAITVDGFEMLVQQAARSYELWTGRTPPVELMRERVRQA